MSFLKITDPTKRDQMVQELLNTRRNIKQESYSKHLGDVKLHDKYTKQFKPITDKLDTIPKAIEPTLSNINTTLAALPANISNALPALTAPAASQVYSLPAPAASLEIEDINTASSADDRAPLATINLGNIASEYMNQLAFNNTDTTYGIHVKSGYPLGTFFIGREQVQIDGNDLIIRDKRYTGTEGLWYLIMDKDADIEDGPYTDDDWNNYKDIMITTRALYNSDNMHPKSNKSFKWKTMLSQIWLDIKSKKGSSIRASSNDNKSSNTTYAAGGNSAASVIFLPSDPDALFDRLDKLLASKDVGNTGLRNEMVAIVDELKRLGQMPEDEYKILNVIINND